MRSSGAVYTLVRTSSIGATRPFTEMQSGNVRHRKHWHARRNTEDNTMTSIGPRAQGKSIKRVVLTGSLLREMLELDDAYTIGLLYRKLLCQKDSILKRFVGAVRHSNHEVRVQAITHA